MFISIQIFIILQEKQPHLKQYPSIFLPFPNLKFHSSEFPFSNILTLWSYDCENIVSYITYITYHHVLLKTR